jgi:hypothetical protein
MQCGVECISFYRGVQALNVGLNAKVFTNAFKLLCGVECKSFYRGVQALSVALSVKAFTKAFKLSMWGSM